MTVKSNFKLDDRIKCMDDVQTCLHYDDSYIGKTGYFAIELCDLSDLSNCSHDTLAQIILDGAGDDIFRTPHDVDYDKWGSRFFVPDSLLKPIEKTYRPLTKGEFLRMFNNGVFGQWITMKNVVAENEYYMQITGCFTSELDIVYVCLGSLHLSLADLFKDFQWKDSDGNWRVFGVEVKDVD